MKESRAPRKLLQPHRYDGALAPRVHRSKIGFAKKKGGDFMLRTKIVFEVAAKILELFFGGTLNFFAILLFQNFARVFFCQRKNYGSS